MSTATLPDFRHEALLYRSQEEFLGATAEFIAAGLARDEPVLAVLAADKIGLLEEKLGHDSGRVRFADMARVGANPARIIPAWHRFVAECTARELPFRGIGEPIWPGRSPEELVECQRHEALLNLAFAGAAGFTLLCPYDTSALRPDVLEEAHHSHPHIVDAASGLSTSPGAGPGERMAPFDRHLPDPSHVLDLVPIVPKGLGRVRSAVVRRGSESGLDRAKVDDLVVAVNEVATNTLTHGGGHGMLRLWRQDGAMICEIRSAGRIADPLAGRIPPREGQESGRGLWLASQLCDLIQVRTYAGGSVVRLHMKAGPVSS